MSFYFLILGLNEHQVLNFTCLVDDSPYATDDKLPNIIGNCECTPVSVHLPALPLTVYHRPSTIHCLPPAVYHPPSTTRRLPSTIYQLQIKTCNNNLFTMR